ncbi:MAG: LysE family transporter, partial [Chloroflexi bacterium]|nr:LysE family transporter [Chloroflexota bacterium]
MDLNLLLKGFVIGFSIAAPVGPIGILCIRRTLVQGSLSGLISGLGAALADAVYGSIAGFGFVVITGFLIDQQMWLRILGGGFLLYLGIRTFFSKWRAESVDQSSTNLWGDFISTFTLTLTNPMTILSFIAIFAGMGLGSVGDNFLSVIVFIFGVFFGSMSWWSAVSG